MTLFKIIYKIYKTVTLKIVKVFFTALIIILFL